MLAKIVSFELRYCLRSPQTWLSFIFFFLLGSLAFGYLSAEGASDLFSLGRNVYLNSPFYISAVLAALSMLAFFIAPSIVGESVIKDWDRCFDGILFTTPVSKLNHLLGRFLGGFLALLIAFCGAPLGMMLSPYWAFTLPEGSLAPLNITTYLNAMVVYALPTLLLFSSMIFTVAIIGRTMIYTYLLNLAVVFFLLVGGVITARTGLVTSRVIPLLDPSLLVVLFNLPTYWTPEQLNTMVIRLDPYSAIIALNRLLVIFGGLGWLVLACLLFSFRKGAARTWSKGKQSLDANHRGIEAIMPVSVVPVVTPRWTKQTAFRQFMLRTLFEFKSVIFSLPFILLVLINLGFMADLLSFTASLSFPLTHVFVNVLTGGTVSIFLLLIVIIFCPEIFWREHKSQFHEIIGALPVPNWVFVVSKLLALVLVLVAMVLINIGLAIFFQMGSAEIDFGVYLERCLVYLLIPFICFAVLAGFFQVISNNRFLGMGLTVAYLLISSGLFVFGYQHPLYQNFLLADNLLPLSDMNGSGRFMIKGYWLRAYWTFMAGLVLMLTYVLWNRGSLQSVKHRLYKLKKFSSARYWIPSLCCFLLIVATGATIFYNTNILNPYLSANELEARNAQYEILYRQYQDLPMPRITDITMEVDIFPYRNRIEVEGEVMLENKTTAPIDTIHLELPQDFNFESLSVAGSSLKSADNALDYYIYSLDTPMQPGERRQLAMKAYKQLRGFKAHNEDVTLVRNGTYFEISALLPHVGFSQNRMLFDADVRQQYGLDPVLPVGKLNEGPLSSRYFNNAVFRADSDLINFEVVLSTVSGQTAVSAGALVDQWQEDGRRYFHYKTDSPIYPVIPFFSAEYALYRDSWHDPDAENVEDVDIEIYYHPAHAYHLELMIESLKHGLAYYSKAFGPYKYRQLRVMEYPGYRNNSRSVPTAIAHSEFNGFVTRYPGATYQTMAHELAHHWWGHQLIAARVEGGGMLGEGFASYSARMLMEDKYGRDYILHRNTIPTNLRYLRGRNSDAFGEVPLNRALGQNYLAYSKTESVMYALQRFLGEEIVNNALSRLVATQASSLTPYAVSTDFLNVLKEEAGSEHLGLIEDLFERITLYEVAMKSAAVALLEDGRYKVTLVISAAKFYGDENGIESQSVFDAPVHLGLFKVNPTSRDFRSDEHVILMEQLYPEDGQSTLEFVLEEKPEFAGIDPYDTLIERNVRDNIVKVIVESVQE